MPNLKRKATTVYLDPRIAQATKVKAAMSTKSVSDLVNESLARYLAEDQADLELAKKRRKEKMIPYETILAEMKRDGLL